MLDEDKIDLFSRIRQGFQELKYNDLGELGRVSKILIMFITDIVLPKSALYLNEFEDLTFVHIGLYVDQEYSKELWENDRQKTIYLIDTIIEDIIIFSSSN